MSKRRILTVVGVRPNFIKCALVSEVLRRDLHEIIVHTGQHYDKQVSDVFFEELSIPSPDYSLGIGSASHAVQTGRMMEGLEAVMTDERPHMVLLYGDTNSTLAGALAAAKLNIPIAHVEAGPRNFDRSIPEEINRVITDRLSSLLFAPTEASVENLAAEGIVDGVENTGDVMLDLAMRYLEEHVPGSSIHSRLEIDPDDYYFATLHRAANTDDPVRLRAILSSLAGLDRPVALPLHPRTRERIRVHGFEDLIRDGQIRVLDAVGYVDSLALQAHARLVFTDSGGVQKEAFFVGTPCVTFYDSTPWVELVDRGWNILVGADPAKIVEACERYASVPPDAARRVDNPFGDGAAAEKMVNAITLFLDGTGGDTRTVHFAGAT